MVLLGCVWLATNVPAAKPASPVISPPPAPPASVAFHQRVDFQTQNLKALQKHWVPGTGNWAVVPESNSPTSLVLRQSDAKREYQFFMSRKAFMNFDFSARLRADSSEVKPRNWQVGFVFHWVDAKHFYKLRVTAANLALARFSPVLSVNPAGLVGNTMAATAPEQTKPEEQMLVFLPIGMSPDQWHTFGVSCRGERITILLDGREVRTITDPGAARGKIALFTYRTSALFDDLDLTALRSPRVRSGILPESNVYSRRKSQELMIYYQNPAESFLECRLLDPAGKVFALLSSGVHNRGLNCMIWDGRGMTGQTPSPGTYTIEVKRKDKRETASLAVKP